MTSLTQRLPRRSRSLGTTGLAAAMLAGALAAGTIAWSQDQSAALPKDVVFARKILMDTIGHNMDELETMTGPGGKVDLTEGQEHADMISVMLMAFPHLFPPATNQWKPNATRDPGTDTFAAPELWTRYADFYRQAAAASKTAYNASRAKQEADFRTYVTELRASCDACHATFLKNE
jgi:cytochrome c556